MIRLLILLAFLASGPLLFCQTNWKLAKEKNGIKVFLASNEGSKFKKVRVQCVFDGTIPKLVSILSDVSGHVNWVYKTKKAYMLKQLSPNEFIYYTETSMPWPVTNRDAVFHLKINPSSDRNNLHIDAYGEATYIAKKEGIVRVPYSKASWNVTEANNKITIDYLFEVDPGGTLPGWLVNLFADKGPMECFQKLADLLKS